MSHSNDHFQKTLICFNKMHFPTLVLPLAFFQLCSQRLGVVCVVFFSVFVLFRFWSLDHRVKIFSFLFNFFPHLFAFFFFILFASFFLAFCRVALPHYLTLMPWGLKLLPCCLVVPCATSSHCLVVWFYCLSTSLFFATWLLSHLRSFLIPPHLLLCASLLHSPFYLVALCWLVLPSSFLFCREELGTCINKLVSNH